MKALLLSLITAGAIAFSAGSADAQPRGHRGGHYNGYPSGVRVYPSVNTSPYWNGYYNSRYYSPNYAYPGSGFALNFGNFGLSVGNGYTYPYYGYNNGYYYAQPYYGSNYYGRPWRNW